MLESCWLIIVEPEANTLKDISSVLNPCAAGQAYDLLVVEISSWTSY